MTSGTVAGGHDVCEHAIEMLQDMADLCCRDSKVAGFICNICELVSRIVLGIGLRCVGWVWHRAGSRACCAASNAAGEAESCWKLWF